LVGSSVRRFVGSSVRRFVGSSVANVEPETELRYPTNRLPHQPTTPPTD